MPDTQITMRPVGLGGEWQVTRPNSGEARLGPTSDLARGQALALRRDLVPIGIEPDIELAVKRDHAAGQPGEEQEHRHRQAPVAV
jgi:hypothetical protein